MNSDRIKMEDYQGVLYCDVILDDEFSLRDLDYMRAEIRKNYPSPTDVILKRTGTYSVSFDAQASLRKGVGEIGNFVYVVDNNLKKISAEYADNSFMKLYNARVANSKEEAYTMLREIPEV